MAIQLQIARLRAESAGSDRLSGLLRQAEHEAAAAVAELRELAHGIYPAVLTESGLEAALRTLADRAPIPVEVEALTEDRFPEDAERVIYLSANEAISAAHEVGSDGICLRVFTSDERLLLEVEGTSERRLAAVEDRVSAAGGEVVRSGRSLQVELPCA